MTVPMTTSKETKLGKGGGAPWYPPLGETVFDELAEVPE